MNNLVGKICSFNSVTEQDTTKIQARFIVHDFEESENRQLITRAICQQNMKSLVHKPIVCRYFDAEGDRDLDHLGDHEVILQVNRDTGDYQLATNTIAIGVITNVSIEEYEGKEVLMADSELWVDRYYNICSLLNDWYEQGVRVSTSCEYLFTNYSVRNGVQYIESPYYYNGLCVLNSQERDGYEVVNPAYSSSHMVSFNEAIKHDIQNHADINNNNSHNERGEKMDVEEKIVEVVETQEEVVETPIVETVEDPVIEEIAEPVVEEIKEEVEVVAEQEETPVVEDATEEVVVEQEVKEETVEELKEKIEEANKTINQLKIEIADSKMEYIDKVAVLNSKIEELKPFKAQVKKQEYDKSLNEKVEYYKTKFSALNSVEKFNEVEVQQLIKDTLDEEKSINAKLSISEILEGCIQTKVEETEKIEEKEVIQEFCNKKLGNLTTHKSYLEIYGIDID